MSGVEYHRLGRQLNCASILPPFSAMQLVDAPHPDADRMILVIIVQFFYFMIRHLRPGNRKLRRQYQ
jgi:hypothetical protein